MPGTRPNTTSLDCVARFRELFRGAQNFPRTPLRTREEAVERREAGDGLAAAQIFSQRWCVGGPLVFSPAIYAGGGAGGGRRSTCGMGYIIGAGYQGTA